MLVGGESKFFYDYVPLDVNKQNFGSTNYTFTTRDLGIPDGTTIEVVDGYYGRPSSYDEHDIKTYVSPLSFSYYYDSWESDGSGYDESLVLWEGVLPKDYWSSGDTNGAIERCLVYSADLTTGDPDLWAKWRYSY